MATSKSSSQTHLTVLTQILSETNPARVTSIQILTSTLGRSLTYSLMRAIESALSRPMHTYSVTPEDLTKLNSYLSWLAGQSGALLSFGPRTPVCFLAPSTDPAAHTKPSSSPRRGTRGPIWSARTPSSILRSEAWSMGLKSQLRSIRTFSSARLRREIPSSTPSQVQEQSFRLLIASNFVPPELNSQMSMLPVVLFDLNDPTISQKAPRIQVPLTLSTSTSPDFQPFSYAEELRRAKRYFEEP